MTLINLTDSHQSDFISFNFKSRDAPFANGTAGVEDAWNGEVVVETAPEANFFALFVAGIKLDFQCRDFLLDKRAFCTIGFRIGPAQLLYPIVQKIHLRE